MHSKKVVYVLSKIGGRKSLTALKALSQTMEGQVLQREINQAAVEIRARLSRQGEKEGE